MDNHPPIDSIYEAIKWDLASARISHKEMATILYPGRANPETASSLFTRALDQNDPGVHFYLEYLIEIIRRTGGQHIIEYLCGLAGYERPIKRVYPKDNADTKAAMARLMVQIRLCGRAMEELFPEEK